MEEPLKNPNANGTSDEIQLNPEDIPYEEELLRNPYSVKTWLRYLDFKIGAPPVRNLIFERALKELPGSYKLWYKYLTERKIQVKGKPPKDVAFERTNNAFERCLVYLHRMPRIWIEYTEFLTQQGLITRTRQAFDRALRALPISQHEKIWNPYIKFIKSDRVPTKTAISVWKRFLMVEPYKREEFVEYLIQKEDWNQAVKELIEVVNDSDELQSSKGKNKQQHWIQVCDIISQHSDEIKDIALEPILRGGMKQFSNDVGKLWTTLADVYIRVGMFEKARDIFEEGMNTVITVKDFTQIWEGYAKFEDSVIAAQMEEMEKEGGKGEDEEDFDLRVARYEFLIDRQPLLVNSVLLRQNPHNVHEWQKRANLYSEDPRMVVETYTTALTTVDPMKAKGKPHTLWVNFARFYEQHGDVESARKIFEKGVNSVFKFTDDLANLWCEYAEMEIRNGNPRAAHALLQRAVTPPPPEDPNDPKEGSEKNLVQRKVFKSTKLWAFYVDLEETCGTLKTTQAAYERMLELKAATPQTIINYAQYLEEHKCFEESFKAYEKGISLFNFPLVFDIWVAYLTHFVKRYGGRKLERARELFEEVCKTAPPSDAKVFYLMYANLEEEFGLARHAMSVYDRATRAVEEKDRFAIYSLYISRATEFFGITRTREIYEKAISVLPERAAAKMSMRYAAVETKLGEIDRARAIFTHGAQIANPQTENEYWNAWRQFEVEFGNPDTFAEMLRIKRTVQAQFNTQVNYMSAEMMAATKRTILEAAQSGGHFVPSTTSLGGTVKETPTTAYEPEDDMARLERQASKFAASKGQQAPEQPPQSGQGVNPEEISMSDEDEEGHNKEEDAMEVGEMPVPAAVFEKNVPTSKSASAPSNEPKIGALARLKRKHAEIEKE